MIAYGAGWTDRERQQPVGDSGHYEPRHIDAIVAAELQRALDEPDPLRGIAQLTARWGAAFVLNPDGVTRTKALGRERIARKLQDTLPGGEHPLRAAVWQFMRPMLSPNLAQLNRDAFVLDEDAAEHRAARAAPRRLRPRRARPRRRGRPGPRGRLSPNPPSRWGRGGWSG